MHARVHLSDYQDHPILPDYHATGRISTVSSTCIPDYPIISKGEIRFSLCSIPEQKNIRIMPGMLPSGNKDVSFSIMDDPECIIIPTCFSGIHHGPSVSKCWIPSSVRKIPENLDVLLD